MYLAILHYVKPEAEVTRHRPAHRQFLTELIKAGTVLLAGRQNPLTGGVILGKAASLAEYQAMMQQDPFALAGIAEYTFIDFTPTLYHSALSPLFDE